MMKCKNCGKHYKGHCCPNCGNETGEVSFLNRIPNLIKRTVASLIMVGIVIAAIFLAVGAAKGNVKSFAKDTAIASTKATVEKQESVTAENSTCEKISLDTKKATKADETTSQNEIYTELVGNTKTQASSTTKDITKITTTKKVEEPVTYNIIANKSTCCYHISSNCPAVKRMYNRNKVYMTCTVWEAESLGYWPCSKCCG